jgi:hypothetical protein
MTSGRLPTGERVHVEQELDAATLGQLQSCDHEWVVFSTDLTNVFLMLECVECGAFATVNDPTEAEWRRAFHAPSRPYGWDDKQRVVIRGRSGYRHDQTEEADRD